MNPEVLLNTLLPELNEAVIACEPDGKILFFNRAAEKLLGGTSPLRPGSSLYSLCCRPPVEQALDLLQFQHSSEKKADSIAGVQFMNASPGQDRFFRCRVRFLSPGTAPKGSFAVLLEDISAWHVPDSPLILKIEQFRAPLANMQAAVENLTEFREMSPVMRSAFENVLVQESINLTEAFNILVGSCKDMMQTHDPLTELDCNILFCYLARHLGHKNIRATASPAEAASVKVDIYSLIQVLDFLLDNIARSQGKAGFACEALVGEQFVYFDFIWNGPVMPAAVVEKMLEQELEHCVKGMTVSSVLRSMDGDLWGQPHGESKSMLRLALPISKNSSQKP